MPSDLKVAGLIFVSVGTVITVLNPVGGVLAAGGITLLVANKIKEKKKKNNDKKTKS